MAVTAAQLQVVVGGETKDAEGKLNSLNDQVNKSGGFFKNALSNALGFALGAGAVDLVGNAVGFLADQSMDVIKAGEQAQQTQAQTVAVLKSTGDASGYTAQQIADMAESYSNLTGIQADTIQSSENVLLTFTNIGHTVFPQAEQSILDVATA